MATVFYSAETEALRRSLLSGDGPSIGVPGNVFVVRTDGGEEIHLPTDLLDEYATIVVTTPECTADFSGHVVMVTNRETPPNRTSRSRLTSAMDRGARAVVGQVVEDAATKAAAPAIGAAGETAR